MQKFKTILTARKATVDLLSVLSLRWGLYTKGICLWLKKELSSDNDYVVVSVFVNPTQFDNAEDLKKYPRTLDRDVALLKTVSDAILVYAPSCR